MGSADKPGARVLPPLVAGPIDTHAHVFLQSLGAVDGSRYAPSGDAPLTTYLDLLQENRISGAILVQPSFLGTDNAFMLAAIERAPDRLRAVAVVEPDADAGFLEELAVRGVVGVRLNLIGAPTLDLAAAPQRALLDRLRRTGLFLELHAEGGQWAELLPAARASGVVVVIDHFGRPAAEPPHPCSGLSDVLAAYEDPHVFVKFSAPYRFAADAAAVARAFLARGAGRIIWGSDWPFTQHPEVMDYAAARDWLEGWVTDARTRAAVLDANARALLAAARSQAAVGGAQLLDLASHRD